MLTLRKSPFLLSALFALVWLSLPEANAHGQDLGVKIFDGTSHDFGDVLKGETPEYRFKFVNRLNKTLHIRSVRSSCGCAEAAASQETFQPGEKGEIICKYNTPTAKFPGKKDVSIIVLFDMPQIVERQLTVKGNIITGVTLEPRIIDFGQVTQRKVRPVKIHLTSTENPHFRIKAVRGVDHINVQAKETRRTETGIVSYELTATLLNSAPKGYFQGEIYLDLELGLQPDGLLKVKTLPLSFTGKLNSTLQLSLDTLDFGPMKPGEVATRKLFLTSPKSFKISDVVQGKGFSVSNSPQSKETHVIEVTFEAGNKPGKQESELKFLVEYPNTSAAQTDPKLNSAVVTAITEIVAPGATINQIDRELHR